MKLVFASDSFKGTLTSRDTAELLERAARNVLGEVECRCVTMADGGEGTADAVVEGAGKVPGSADCGKIVCRAHDALMREICAEYGYINNKVAVIEMAAAAGLTLVAKPQRNPLVTSSYGVGEMIKDALTRDFREIYVTLGGSATNDGGMGCMRALGARFLDAHGRELQGCGADLEKVVEIDLSEFCCERKNVDFVTLTDVGNPLCGRNGATMVFGRQKGADDQMLLRLEEGMVNLKQVMQAAFHTDPDSLVGGGAAGGLGAAMQLFLNARQQSGIEAMLQLTDFDSVISDVDLVITGEGRADSQSLQGKVVSGIARHCAMQDVPCVALVGSKGEGADELLKCGVSKIVAIADERVSEDYAISHPRECYLQKAEQMFRMLKKEGFFAPKHKKS